MAISQGAASALEKAWEKLGPRDWLFWEFLRPGLKAGDRIRTGDVQLGKLTFYH